MTAPLLGLIVLAIMLVVAIAFVVAGILRVVKLGRALKERLDGYKELPILAYVDRTQVRVTRATRGLETASVLVYRARAATTDIANARVKLQAVLTSPTSLLRLATTLVTGR